MEHSGAQVTTLLSNTPFSTLVIDLLHINPYFLSTCVFLYNINIHIISNFSNKIIKNLHI
jgi:hypothetical protein